MNECFLFFYYFQYKECAIITSICIALSNGLKKDLRMCALYVEKNGWLNDKNIKKSKFLYFFRKFVCVCIERKILRGKQKHEITSFQIFLKKTH